jgi:putative ABC transport system substrate-binding protein
MGDAKRHRRRDVLGRGLALAGVSLLAGCHFGLQSDAPPKPARIGYLALTLDPKDPLLQVFADAMRDLGYVEGRDYVMEYRGAQGSRERLADAAAELVRLNVDVIVAAATPETLAAKQATTRISIIFTNIGAPVQTGIVDSLAHPGGNATGLSSNIRGVVVKLLELLKEAVPAVTRVAILVNPAGSGATLQEDLEHAAAQFSVTTQPLTVSGPGQFEGAFATLSSRTANGLVMIPDSLFFTRRDEIVGLVTRYSLPSAFSFPEFASAGGLLAYGPNSATMLRQSATYVDKILKGAQPDDLPVEQPTTFDFVVNLKTARALGQTIPPSVLAQATDLIQ